jgi:Spy/CpxP family protein refolding chaperone
MKKSVLLTALLLLVFAVGSITALAQRERDVEIEKKVIVTQNDNSGPYCNIPGLTDEQRDNMEKLRLVHQKKVRLMHANLQEKRAHIRTLRLADNPDMQQINKTIDEIAALQGDLMKEREAHRQAIRSGLNEEQKAWFDSRPDNARGFGGQGGMNGIGPNHKGRNFCDGTGSGYGRDRNDRPFGRGQMRQERIKHLEAEEDD